MPLNTKSNQALYFQAPDKKPVEKSDQTPCHEQKINELENKTTESNNYGKHAEMPILQQDQYASVSIPRLDMFNIDDIKLDSTVVAVGKRRTGKTWCFRHIMYAMKDKLQAGIVISQTDPLNKFWRQYVPKKYIYPKYHPEILTCVFERQKQILNDPELTEDEKDKKAPFFVLLDDVISDQRLKYDENLMELFVAGRHYRLFVMITTQYAKAITPTLRGNTDYCFMMKCLQGRQREALWEDFGDFLTRDAFNQILDAYTEDNETLVVNTCPEQKVDPLDMMFWFKACDPGPFHVGNDDYWKSQYEEHDAPPADLNQGASSLMNMPSIFPEPYRTMFGIG